MKTSKHILAILVVCVFSSFAIERSPVLYTPADLAHLGKSGKYGIKINNEVYYVLVDVQVGSSYMQEATIEIEPMTIYMSFFEDEDCAIPVAADNILIGFSSVSNFDPNIVNSYDLMFSGYPASHTTIKRAWYVPSSGPKSLMADWGALTVSCPSATVLNSIWN